MQKQQLTIHRTATGYWTVRRGSVELAGAMTREAAERERELLLRLSECSERRTGSQRREQRHVAQA